MAEDISIYAYNKSPWRGLMRAVLTGVQTKQAYDQALMKSALEQKQEEKKQSKEFLGKLAAAVIVKGGDISRGILESLGVTDSDISGFKILDKPVSAKEGATIPQEEKLLRVEQPVKPDKPLSAIEQFRRDAYNQIQSDGIESLSDEQKKALGIYISKPTVTLQTPEQPDGTTPSKHKTVGEKQLEEKQKTEIAYYKSIAKNFYKKGIFGSGKKLYGEEAEQIKDYRFLLEKYGKLTRDPQTEEMYLQGEVKASKPAPKPASEKVTITEFDKDVADGQFAVKKGKITKDKAKNMLYTAYPQRKKEIDAMFK